MLINENAPLSTNLRRCTAAVHDYAEQLPFMFRLLGGTLTTEAVADYTGQLWFIYDALERSVRATARRPRMATIVDPRLERLEAIERDLTELIGPQWRSLLIPTPATGIYVECLEGLAAAGDELGLIAHHYVRYLGDLAGGQVIARLLRQQYGISDRGVNFYDFSSINRIKPYRDDYRRRLDALDLDGAEVAGVIAEANQAFDLSGAILRTLAARHCCVTETAKDVA